MAKLKNASNYVFRTIIITIVFTLILGTALPCYSAESLKSYEKILQSKDPVDIMGRTHYYQQQFPDVYLNNTLEGNGKALSFSGASIIAYTDVLCNMGFDETPETIVEYINSLEDLEIYQGFNEKVFQKISDKFGICMEFTDEEEHAIQCLENGGFVISYQTSGLFTKSGHYITLCDYYDNTVLVLDSNIYTREMEEDNNFRFLMDDINDSNYMYICLLK